MPSNSIGDRRAAPANTDRVGGEFEEHVAGERVVTRMQRRQPSGDVTQVVPASETAQRDVDRSLVVIVS